MNYIPFHKAYFKNYPKYTELNRQLFKNRPTHSFNQSESCFYAYGKTQPIYYKGKSSAVLKNAVLFYGVNVQPLKKLTLPIPDIDLINRHSRSSGIPLWSLKNISFDKPLNGYSIFAEIQQFLNVDADVARFYSQKFPFSSLSCISAIATKNSFDCPFLIVSSSSYKRPSNVGFDFKVKIVTIVSDQIKISVKGKNLSFSSTVLDAACTVEK